MISHFLSVWANISASLDSNVAMPSRRILVRIGRLRILSHFLSMALRSSDRQRL